MAKGLSYSLRRRIRIPRCAADVLVKKPAHSEASHHLFARQHHREANHRPIAANMFLMPAVHGWGHLVSAIAWARGEPRRIGISQTARHTMKSPVRTLLVATALGAIPGVISLIIGIYEYFHGPDPASSDPDPELAYILPILVSFLWTFFVIFVVSVAIGVSGMLHRLRFRRRMQRLGLMDEHGRWLCTKEEAESFEKIFG